MRIYLLSLCQMVFPLSADSLKPSVAVEPARDVITAEQILERMAKAYAECKTYSDTGLVRTVYFTKPNKMIEEKKFSTAFVRPDRFRFEYTEKTFGVELRHIIWRKGDRVLTWWDIKPGVEEKESLGRALAGAAGVSSGSSHKIPALLLPNEVGGRRITKDLEEVKRIDDAMLENVDCYRIEGAFGDHPMEVWVDKNTFLIRRVDSRVQLDQFHTECTTTYVPEVNVDIVEKKLKFNAPDKR